MTSAILVDQHGQPIAEPERPLVEVFIVCEGGKPIAACTTEHAVRRVCGDLDKHLIRVHQVPVER